jgi:hypothetical protein
MTCREGSRSRLQCGGLRFSNKPGFPVILELAGLKAGLEKRNGKITEEEI